MKNYQVYFVVEIYDGEETRSDAGFVPANSFREAVEYIETYYGNELVLFKHLELLDISMLTMRPETADLLLAEIY